MDFLTVAGISLYILVAGATQQESEPIGQAKRSFSGALRSSRRNFKRKWRFVVGPVSQSAHNTLRAAVEANGGIVTCNGVALDSTNVDCMVTIGAADYVRDGDTGHLRTLELLLEEA